MGTKVSTGFAFLEDDVTGNPAGFRRARDGKEFPLSNTRRSNWVALIGDSIAGYNFGAVPVTAAVRSANVLTVTATGHLLQTGGSFALGGVTNDTSMNGSFIRNVTYIDANTFSVPSVGPNGTAIASGGFAGFNLQSTSQHGFFQWAQMFSGNKLELCYAAAQGGAVISEVAAYVNAVIASGASYCIVNAGVNDAANAYTADQMFTNMTTLVCQPLMAAGVMPIVMSIIPFNSAHASFATATPKIVRYNQLMRQWAYRTQGVKFVEAFKQVVNPTSSPAGAAATGMMDSSNLHPSAKGARAAGVALSSAINSEPLSASDFLMQSNVDGSTANALSTNLMDDGLMQGTGGSVSAPVTGTMPTNWAASTSGTITAAAASLVSRSDGIGQDIQVVVQPGAANAQIILNSQTAALFGKVTGGRWLQIGANITATGISAANCSNISIYLAVRVDGITYSLGTTNGFTSDTADANDWTSGYDLISVPFWVPQGSAYANVFMYCIARFSASSASSLTLKVGRATVRARDDLA